MGFCHLSFHWVLTRSFQSNCPKSEVPNFIAPNSPTPDLINSFLFIVLEFFAIPIQSIVDKCIM